jgi:hypothetical protein
MEEWAAQHEKKESLITTGVQKVIDANAAKWDGIVKRAKWWNFTFALLHTISIAVLLVVAWAFYQMVIQMRSDSAEFHDYLQNKKIQDAAQSKVWYEYMERWKNYGNKTKPDSKRK